MCRNIRWHNASRYRPLYTCPEKLADQTIRRMYVLLFLTYRRYLLLYQPNATP